MAIPKKKPQRGLNWLQKIIDSHAKQLKGDALLKAAGQKTFKYVLVELQG